MTNMLALCFGALAIALVTLDYTLSDGANLLYLGRKLIALIEWMAFWR